MRHIEIPSSLFKSASGEEWKVGGVASGYWKDLDGEAITPDAVKSAIDDFMAARGADGIRGGPIHLHHGFWDGFLRRAIQYLGLSNEEQMKLIAGISLPLGRVTEMWVDGSGTTHWRGVLSKANPISKVIWDLLKEKLVSLGVSLGGKILSTSQGFDRLGRPCGLITQIRLDELSVTANPALRLTQAEDPSNGAYIAVLNKAVQTSLSRTMNQVSSVQRFLQKALNPSVARYSDYAQDWGSPNAFNSGDTSLSLGVMSEPLLTDPQKPGKRGSHRGSVVADVAPGIGSRGNNSTARRPVGKHGITTDVWGLTIPQFAQELGKCAKMDVQAFSSPEVLSLFQGGAAALANLTPNPPMELINFVRLLQQISMFAQGLPRMSPWQAEGTLTEMKKSLQKGLENFQETLPKDLVGKPFRPEGSPSIQSIEIPFPEQYRQY